jgi:signal transduction histidine kinase
MVDVNWTRWWRSAGSVPSKAQALVALTVVMLAAFAVAAWPTTRGVGAPLVPAACSSAGAGIPGGTLGRWLPATVSPSSLPIVGALFLAALACGTAALIAVRRDAELAEIRSDFVTGVSHELRTPLMQILLFGEMLSMGRARSERERHDAAETVVREARRLTTLVDNVLHFSRVEHHNVGLAMLEDVALAEFIAPIMIGARSLVTGTGVTLETRVPHGLAARVDRDQLRQVLLNLIDNALKYGPRGQWITVGAALVDAGRVQIWVEDEGPGIPARDATRIFEPFVRLHRHRRSAIAGSGLGLAVVHDLVQRQHGRVWVESAATTIPDARGARFVVEVPGHATGPVGIGAPRVQAPPSLRGGRSVPPRAS